MKKLSLFLCILLLSVGNVCGQMNLPLTPDDSIPLGPRSTMTSVMATVDNPYFIIDFTSATASQVVIINEGTNQTVYSDNFASTTQVIIDLEDEGIGEGSYLLRIYAFGKWWWGEFVIEEE